MSATAALGIFIFYRYYFFGKNAVLAERSESPEVWQKRAQVNKRNWGYKAVYKPTLERSRKKQILDVMGGKDYLT